MIEFEVPNNSPYNFIDLKNSRLRVIFQIVANDTAGTALEAETLVSVCNLPLQAMFSQVDLSLQGIQTVSNTHYYPYKAYIDCLENMKFRDMGKVSQLFYIDDGGEFDR